ncbi:MAG: cytochrome c biogenesis protein CcsA [Pirellulaceae bacterium]
MLPGITITCFAASYGVSLALEISRLFFRAPIRLPVIFAFTGAGLFAHTSYLMTRAQTGISEHHGIPPLSSWYDFCLLAAWLLAAAYLIMSIRRPRNAVGIFLLPLILGLIGVAVAMRDTRPFQEQTALNVWRVVHGIALTAGTATVALGFATGMMYLVQSYRLKRKLPPRPGFRLPSLELLQRFNRESLMVSACLLAMGLVSGVALNLSHQTEEGRAVQWTDPVVL